jgi:uncharacterized membrane protein
MQINKLMKLFKAISTSTYLFIGIYLICILAFIKRHEKLPILINISSTVVLLVIGLLLLLSIREDYKFNNLRRKK